MVTKNQNIKYGKNEISYELIFQDRKTLGIKVFPEGPKQNPRGLSVCGVSGRQPRTTDAQVVSMTGDVVDSALDIRVPLDQIFA